jgi:hypothetical protein
VNIKCSRHPEEPRILRGVSKDRRERRLSNGACGHPSRLAVKNGEHLRMTAEIFWTR